MYNNKLLDSLIDRKLDKWNDFNYNKDKMKEYLLFYGYTNILKYEKYFLDSNGKYLDNFSPNMILNLFDFNLFLYDEIKPFLIKLESKIKSSILFIISLLIDENIEEKPGIYFALCADKIFDVKPSEIKNLLKLLEDKSRQREGRSEIFSNSDVNTIKKMDLIYSNIDQNNFAKLLNDENKELINTLYEYKPFLKENIIDSCGNYFVNFRIGEVIRNLSFNKVIKVFEKLKIFVKINILNTFFHDFLEFWNSKLPRKILISDKTEFYFSPPYSFKNCQDFYEYNILKPFIEVFQIEMKNMVDLRNFIDHNRSIYDYKSKNFKTVNSNAPINIIDKIKQDDDYEKGKNLYLTILNLSILIGDNKYITNSRCDYEKLFKNIENKYNELNNWKNTELEKQLFIWDNNR